jgi:hypothetical protein
MNKNIVYPLAICFAGSIAAVIALYLTTTHYNRSDNSFIRQFPNVGPSGEKLFDIQFDSYYIAGISSSHIYLGNVVAPDHMIITDLALTDTQHVKLNIPDRNELLPRTLRVRVDSPFVYMTDYLLSTIWKGVLPDPTMLHFIDNPRFSSSLIEYRSPGTFVVRTYDSSQMQNRLGVLSQDGVKYGKKTLTKQIDGYFCTDGMINCNNETSSVIYVYYYRNEFIRLDSNLNIIYRGRTIDTTSTAKIKVAQIKAENKTTLSAPPLLVNRMSAVFGNNLFISSALKANNEQERAFATSAVVDVYDVDDGEYKYSFYLPNSVEGKIRDFAVTGNKAVTLIDHHIIVFELQLL